MIYGNFIPGFAQGLREPSCSDGHLSAQVTNRSPTRERAVTTLETNLAGGSPGCSPDPLQVPGEMHPAHENSTLTPPYVSGFERRLPALLIPRGCHTRDSGRFGSTAGHKSTMLSFAQIVTLVSFLRAQKATCPRGSNQSRRCAQDPGGQGFMSS